MTKFMNKRFQVPLGGKDFCEGYEQIDWGRKVKKPKGANPCPKKKSRGGKNLNG